MFAVVHHPRYVVPSPDDARYKWNKNGMVRALLEESGVPIEWIEPEPMPRAWLERVHCPAYVAEVLAAAVPREKERRIGFPVTEAVARRAQLVPGGTWRAAREAMARGFALNNAGGSHHALRDTGAGYCVFNDLAVAAVRLAEEGERVLIVDCDVHQGDGTAALTAGFPDIATFSIHAENNFPVRKAASSVDVPCPTGRGTRLISRHSRLRWCRWSSGSRRRSSSTRAASIPSSATGSGGLRCRRRGWMRATASSPGWRRRGGCRSRRR